MPFRFLLLPTALLLALPAQGQTPAPAPAPASQGTPPPRRPPVPARPARPAAQPPAPAASPAPAAAPPLVVEPGKGSVTGLAIPRFASLRSNEVNLRVGPGTDRPAEWTYHRRELPVEIVSEFQQWRQIRDMDGTVGWVHAATLTGRRTFVVKAAETMMRRRPEADGAPVARLMPGVVGRIRACAAGAAWCEVQAGEYRGYVLRSGIWGLSAEENVGG
jgi:SH3-like domain-containing protein